MLQRKDEGKDEEPRPLAWEEAPSVGSEATDGVKGGGFSRSVKPGNH